VKQVLQSLASGNTEVVQVPPPSCGAGRLLVQTRVSLISTGTERMLVEFGKASLLEKARQQPDKVRMTLEKMRTDGFLPTIEAVRRKLDQPLALGYCNVGTILEVGEGVQGYSVGDRVASNGSHAEIVSVPQHLCAKVPDAVTDQNAAFTVISAIALQGIRLVSPTLGESVAVIGAGLIGLATIQLLRAHGCRVLAIDFDESRLQIAKDFGAETVSAATGDPLAAAAAFTRHRGIDAAIITASTSSSVPVRQAAQMCRKRGRVVLVGVTGLELSRADFYEKELSFQVSCSYGPGRYDPEYEDKGRDYPFGFVRWTEQRNLEAVLDMMSEGRMDLSGLVTHEYPIDRAGEAYDLLSGSTPSLGVLLRYPQSADAYANRPEQRTVRVAAPRSTSQPRLAFIGSGNYAIGTLIPAFKDSGADLRTVASRTGVSAVHAAKKFGIADATTDIESVFIDAAVNAVVIATRHDSHAALVQRALRAGKHVFVEKPLAIRVQELEDIEREHEKACRAESGSPVLMVGFNRRFAPQVRRVAELIRGTSAPASFIMTVNAGAVPAGHWTQDNSVGGGRIVGEACHFIDLLRFLARSPIRRHHAVRLGTDADTVSIHLEFESGSIGAIHYFANGSRAFPKERLEVFAGGKILQLDNFRTLAGYGWPGFRSLRLWRQDKGQRQCVAAFVSAIRSGGESPIAFEELIEVSRVTAQISEELN
jgi:predicted dehydrogenase